MKDKVTAVLKSILPADFNIMVSVQTNSFDNSEYMRIGFSPNTKEINNVRGQFAQVVSLRLELPAMELQTQIYGGCGGGSIYRNIDENNPGEKYLAMKSVKIPFRKPKKEEKFVLKAIERFAQNYLIVLKENFDLLRYKEIVDYSFLDEVVTNKSK